MMNRLIKLSEPSLLFRYGQSMEDPRDGLTLFGPLDEGKPYGIRAGVIGTKRGCERFARWVEKIRGPVVQTPLQIGRPPYPGFAAIFGIPWDSKPAIELNVDAAEISRSVRIDDKYQRVFNTVNLFAQPIIECLRKEETKPDVWFIIVPDEVYHYCRPESVVFKLDQVKAEVRMKPSWAQRVSTEPFLFDEETQLAEAYQYEVNFHNQLKGRLLTHQAPTQVIRESTIAHWDFLNHRGEPKRKLDKLQSSIAWNLSTTAFYKAGGKPWKISGVREGVCYIGLVFKKDERNPDPRSACCAAQMFLDSGDGVVFKGNVGPWYSPETDDYHLSIDDAHALVAQAITEYRKKHNNKPPNELFIHGRVRFDEREWNGFREAAGKDTNVVGVRIKHESDLRIYRCGDQPIMRGLAYARDERTGYLWSKGFIPRLQTYPGMEVPSPLLVDICKGYADIRVVMQDIMALTKLNYNACIFADGLPVTLRFADAVGEILTSGPMENIPPLPFKHYI
jgi:hypothetical protein